MSHNILCILGLMCFSLCLSVWTIISVFRKMSAQDAEDSAQKKASQLYPDAIAFTQLEHIIESRKQLLTQMAANGRRIEHLNSLPYESWKIIRDHLEGAYFCQSLAVDAYSKFEYPEATKVAQIAKQALQMAYDKLYPTEINK